MNDFIAKPINREIVFEVINRWAIDSKPAEQKTCDRDDKRKGGRASNAAADILGIHPNTLRGRMKKLGIQYKRQKASTYRSLVMVTDLEIMTAKHIFKSKI